MYAPGKNMSQAPLAVFLGAAVLAHIAFGLLLLLARVDNADVTPDQHLLTFRLIPPAEGEAPIYMVSTNPQAMPPAGKDNVTDPDKTLGGSLDLEMGQGESGVPEGQLAEFMASEREALKNELEQLTEIASAEPAQTPKIPLPMPSGGGEGASGDGPESAIRELDLEGYPQPVIDDIMARYKLKVVTKQFTTGHHGQNFLSSASKGSSEKFFGGMSVPAGIYEVFQLSRESVAHMSRLEEQALRDKGFEPLKSRVVKIVFGIVKTGTDTYDLGVKSLEAKAVAP